MKTPKFLGRNIQVHQSYSTIGMLGFTSIFFRSFVGFSGPFQAMFAFFLFPICFTRNFRAAPLLTNTPYIWAWNAPSVLCDSKFNVPIDLSLFSFIGNPQKNVIGQNVTIFYIDRLGYYPYINSVNHTDVNGGIPQVGSLQKHLAKAKDDILYYMPQDKLGLAVIDWEEWRPIWARNWKPKDIYQQKSIELVLQNNVQLSEEEATKIAKVDFEKAARDFMQETLKVGKSLRPKHLWGYYLFPNCYNYNYNEPSYNGSCPDIEKSRNNELFWLWEESTALYPSIYLNDKLTSSPEATLYVRNRIQETIRISEVLNAQDPLPIFVYARPVFSGGFGEYLSQADLVSTIGESIALGASGIVMWGSLNLSQSMQSCMDLDIYMKSTLNPYLINVTLAAKMCSQVLCQEQGVCIRKHWNSSDYLHLNQMNFAIKTGKGGKYFIYGKPTLNDLHYFSEKFHCSCYPNVSCHETFNMQTTDIVDVCITDDICIEGFIGTELSTISSTSNEEPSTTSSNVSSYTPSTECDPGIDFNDCLKIKCSVEELLNNEIQKDCESMRRNNSNYLPSHKINQTTRHPPNAGVIKFPIYIFYISISFTFLYFIS